MNDTIQSLPGEIVSVQGPMVGPASAMSYTADVSFPSGVRRVTGLIPRTDRWPDTIDSRALPVGKLVHVFSIAGNLVLGTAELPDIADCPGGG